MTFSFLLAALIVSRTNLIHHINDFSFIFTYVSIFSAHKNDLLWYLYSTIGGAVFLLSTFYGAVQRRKLRFSFFDFASALNDELRACLINSGMYKSERFFRKTRHFLKAYSAYSEKNNAELRKKIHSFVRFVIF